MAWDCIARGRSPTAIRTGYDLKKAGPRAVWGGDLAERPVLGPPLDTGEAGEAFGEWLGHLHAGRIVVR